MGKGPIIAGLIVLILLVGGVFAVTTGNDDKNSTNNTSSEIPAVPGKDSEGSKKGDTQSAATIVYDGNTFSPTSVTVQSGDSVTIKNESSINVQFDSDPHPRHTDNEDLNANLIKPGASKTIVVTQKGEYGYHNHLNASQKGTITVQ